MGEHIVTENEELACAWNVVMMIEVIYVKVIRKLWRLRFLKG
jgi:hypothetical protein